MRSRGMGISAFCTALTETGFNKVLETKTVKPSPNKKELNLLMKADGRSGLLYEKKTDAITSKMTRTLESHQLAPRAMKLCSPNF